MKYLQVAVGIIRDRQRGIFITQRGATSHMANKWEFPGGKIEAGETEQEGLARELLEETGIQVLKAEAIGSAEHQSQDVTVTLHFFLVEDWQGEPWGKEGQPQRWIAQHLLIADEFPPANRHIVQRLVEGRL